MEQGRTDGELWVPGRRVWVTSVRDHGLVLSVSRDRRRAMVEVNRVKMSVAVDTLQEERAVPRRGSGTTLPSRHARSRPRAPREIDMHGLRVEEMIARLEPFLNHALLEGCPEVRVIHGHGSGALRKALHKRLAEMGFRRFWLGAPGQTPGGDGVTIIPL